MSNTLHKNGFTFVELSVVLVIIGLIVGGVMVGRQLMQTAKLHAVIREFSTIKTAMMAFKLQYRYLPGDMPTATQYWGAYDGSLNLCGTGTTNGDGDGSFDMESATWSHLQLAGIVPGCYYPLFDNSFYPNGPLPGKHVYASRFNSTAGWTAWGNADHGQGVNYLWLATTNGPNPSPTQHLSWVDGGAVTAEQALAIDSKLDDGKAQSGLVLPSLDCGNDPCYCMVGDMPGEYDINDTSGTCRLDFLLGK